MNVGVSSSTLDASAVGLSSLCLLHCLILPVLTAVLPVAGILAETEWIHKMLLFLVLPLSGLVINRSLQTGPSIPFIAGAVLGITLLFGAAFIEPLHVVETQLTVAGATLLAAAHGYRFASHRQ